MQVPNYYLAQRLSEQRLQECTRQAEMRCLLEREGVDQRGWFHFQACRLVSGLGCLLVAMGRWLERVASPPVASPAGLPKTSGA
jgi:hypothetical protein